MGWKAATTLRLSALLREVQAGAQAAAAAAARGCSGSRRPRARAAHAPALGSNSARRCGAVVGNVFDLLATLWSVHTCKLQASLFGLLSSTASEPLSAGALFGSITPSLMAAAQLTPTRRQQQMQQQQVRRSC